ncbi:MAG: 16S rRNA (cytidine(1402)-2'-O)-methyltransferase [Alphaproteobacteria bacterium]
MAQGKQTGRASKPAAQAAAARTDAPEANAPDGVSSPAAALAPLLPPGLYVVATPIGNAADITLRALDVLKNVDAIACEDSRVTMKLMARHGIGTKLIAYHEHNAAEMRPKILAGLRRGSRIALVSDAGTPLVSDPGYKLVRDAIDEGLAVVPLPGPSAPLAALILSGLPSDRFLFAGFLPPKSAARRAALGELAAVPATLIFFESAQRLGETLADMADVLGARPAAVSRELTKLYEETRRGDLRDLAEHYAAAGAPKGEIVVCVGGADAATQAASAESLDDHLRRALANASVKDAAALVAAATGLPRKQVYARALELKTGK